MINCGEKTVTKGQKLLFMFPFELCPEFIIDKNIMVHNGLKVLPQFDKLIEKQLHSHNILMILVLETYMTAFSRNYQLPKGNCIYKLFKLP